MENRTLGFKTEWIRWTIFCGMGGSTHLEYMHLDPNEKPGKKCKNSKISANRKDKLRPL